MRGKDVVSVLMNKAYTAIFEAVGATKHFGPRSKHANPVGVQTTQYPIFVLQLQCEAKEYDLLLEPDKTVASYARERALRECLAALCHKMLNHYIPDFPATREFVEEIFETTSTPGVEVEAEAGSGQSLSLSLEAVGPLMRRKEKGLSTTATRPPPWALQRMRACRP